MKIGNTDPFTGFGTPPKRDAGKINLTRRLRRETTMTLNWIAKQLNMETAGSLGNLLRKTKWNQKYAIMRDPFTAVTQAVSRMNRKPARKLRSMCETLLGLET